MKLIQALLIFFCLYLAIPTTLGAQQVRPFSGCGIVIIRPLNSERQSASVPVTFYRDPGVARIAEFSAGTIPALSSILHISGGEYPLAVMAKKGNWLHIAYDDAGREGWVEMARWWNYSTWEDFLKGRIARLFPGQKKRAYALHEGPAESTPQTGTLSGRETLKVIKIVDDWAMVIADSGLNGWISWRDGDGRFQIAIEEYPGTQKY